MRICHDHQMGLSGDVGRPGAEAAGRRPSSGNNTKQQVV